MKTSDYINSLIKERDNFKEICKSHVETIQLLNKELIKKDKKIIKLEKDCLNSLDMNKQKQQKNKLEIIKSELDALKKEYDELQHKYNDVVKENEELKIVLDVIENMSDSD